MPRSVSLTNLAATPGPVTHRELRGSITTGAIHIFTRLIHPVLFEIWPTALGLIRSSRQRQYANPPRAPAPEPAMLQ